MASANIYSWHVKARNSNGESAWSPVRTFTVQPQAPNSAYAWSSTGSLSEARAGHTATLFPSGKVLVVGGYRSSTGLASAELYDPATNTWSLAASMSTRRESHSMTLLPSGKILVAGGGTTIQPNLATAELYDPAANIWSPAATMSVARAYHSATLLPSGKVLVAGGDSGSYCSTVLASAELYDPATNIWSPTASMSKARGTQTATLLPAGNVLIAGGGGAAYSNLTFASAELYSPAPKPGLAGVHLPMVIR